MNRPIAPILLVPMSPVGSAGQPSKRRRSDARGTPPGRATGETGGRALGDEIVLHRRRQNMSQTSLARRLGVHQQTVSRWEAAGVVPPPSRVIALEDVFELDRGVLLRLAGYVTDTTSADPQITLPRLLSTLNGLDDEELVVLIDSAWQIHRERVRRLSAAQNPDPTREASSNAQTSTVEPGRATRAGAAARATAVSGKAPGR